MNCEWYGMYEDAARASKVMHHLEHIVLVQDVLGSSVIRDQPVFALMLRGYAVEIQIHDNRSDPAIDVHAAIFDAESFLQQPGRLLTCIGRIEQDWIDLGLMEGFAQPDHEILLRAPEVL